MLSNYATSLGMYTTLPLWWVPVFSFSFFAGSKAARA
jgi:hypothetical protein